MPAQQQPSLWRRIQQWISGGSALPESRKHQMLRDLPLLAVDLELTSLDPQKAKVTSIGWTEGKAGSIDLSHCYYAVVRASGDLEQSPVIHGLTAYDIAQGTHIREALERLAPYAQTHVWVFHNAGLDLAVLDKVLTANDMYLPEVITLDTLKLAVYQLQKQHDVLPPNSATLTVCRQRLNLPLAPTHNALDDAMATLQLWFAQYYSMDPTGKMSLQDIAHTQAVGCKNLGKSDKK
ncbi:3'-5' exonuclease [uncultured Alteromonas sp.]|jgi:DNA polymerase-3 subunit epsilon|uniref:3'-5' exonuclease n=1 Tax=uncultured Alteromonas sp. TaxID=179113 RepID=UPI0025EEDD55|nr:3'-5' exonuclease [uncultured Alteromonas sp.]